MVEEQVGGGRYDRIKRIGRGAYGDVFLAKATSNAEVVPAGTRVAIKAMFIRDLDEASKDMALQEVRLLRNLEHPHIVRYYDCFSDDMGYLYVVMEYCVNGDLASFLSCRRNSGLPLLEKEVMRFAGEIAECLAYLKVLRIIHRDLKPSNVFLDSALSVKIGDFGVSKALTSTSLFASSLRGTPLYVAPELLVSAPYDCSADAWALGCIVYEMATFSPPFNGTNFMVLVHRITTGAYADLPPAYSESLSNLIRCLLVSDPAERASVDVVLSLFVRRPKLLASAERKFRADLEEAEASARNPIEDQAGKALLSTLAMMLEQPSSPIAPNVSLRMPSGVAAGGTERRQREGGGAVPDCQSVDLQQHKAITSMTRCVSLFRRVRSERQQGRVEANEEKRRTEIREEEVSGFADLLERAEGASELILRAERAERIKRFEYRSQRRREKRLQAARDRAMKHNNIQKQRLRSKITTVETLHVTEPPAEGETPPSSDAAQVVHSPADPLDSALVFDPLGLSGTSQFSSKSGTSHRSSVSRPASSCPSSRPISPSRAVCESNDLEGSESSTRPFTSPAGSVLGASSRRSSITPIFDIGIRGLNAMAWRNDAARIKTPHTRKLLAPLPMPTPPSQGPLLRDPTPSSVTPIRAIAPLQQRLSPLRGPVTAALRGSPPRGEIVSPSLKLSSPSNQAVSSGTDQSSDLELSPPSNCPNCVRSTSVASPASAVFTSDSRVSISSPSWPSPSPAFSSTSNREQSCSNRTDTAVGHAAVEARSTSNNAITSLLALVNTRRESELLDAVHNLVVVSNNNKR